MAGAWRYYMFTDRVVTRTLALLAYSSIIMLSHVLLSAGHDLCEKGRDVVHRCAARHVCSTMCEWVHFLSGFGGRVTTTTCDTATCNYRLCRSWWYPLTTTILNGLAGNRATWQPKHKEYIKATSLQHATTGSVGRGEDVCRYPLTTTILGGLTRNRITWQSKHR